MNNNENKGRNLLKSPRFDSQWNAFWKQTGPGGVRVFEDPEFERYLMMNDRAIVEQEVKLPVFTEEQFKSVNLRIGFFYDNNGGGTNSKVIVKTSKGKEFRIDLSGIPPAADWNPYPLDKIVGLDADDTGLTVALHGSAKTGSTGLRWTDGDIDVLLPAFAPKSISVELVSKP